MRYRDPTNPHNWSVVHTDSRGRPIVWTCVAHFGVLYIVRKGNDAYVTCNSVKSCSDRSIFCHCQSPPISKKCPLANVDGEGYKEIMKYAEVTVISNKRLVEDAAEYAKEWEKDFELQPEPEEIVIDVPVAEILNLLTEVISE